MKTLSNAELQDAIMWAVKLIKGDNSKQDTILLVHLENLTDEQRKRATDELTLEPIESTLERAEFDARVRGQYGPEWIEVEGDRTIVVELGPRDTIELKYRDGETRKDSHSIKFIITPWQSLVYDIVAYRVFRGGA